ncbi:hypothetical protein [Desulfitobacterium sp. AusDCA]
MCKPLTDPEVINLS